MRQHLERRWFAAHIRTAMTSTAHRSKPSCSKRFICVQTLSYAARAKELVAQLQNRTTRWTHASNRMICSVTPPTFATSARVTPSLAKLGALRGRVAWICQHSHPAGEALAPGQPPFSAGTALPAIAAAGSLSRPPGSAARAASGSAPAAKPIPGLPAGQRQVHAAQAPPSNAGKRRHTGRCL